MEIVPLYEHPELAGQVTALLEAEFGTPMGKHFYPELVEHSQTPNGLPLTMVAVEDGRLQGTVGVWRTDMLSRQDLTPWLACLVVRPELRSRGIGRALQEAVKEYCRGQGFPAVYLYTTLVGYYERSGWRYLGKGYEMDGSEQRIYSFPLQGRDEKTVERAGG